MQLNVTLSSRSPEQAQILRSAWYPNTSSKQTRDSFIFNECLDRFQEEDPQVLLPIIESEDSGQVAQRMLTIKQPSHQRLKVLSAALGESMAATYRAIIAYSIQHLHDRADDGSDEDGTDRTRILQVMDQLALLETQLDECKKAIQEIKSTLFEL